MAFNIHSEYWDQSFGGNDSSNEMPHGVANFLYRFFHVLCRLLFRYEVKNPEVIHAFQGKTTGAVLCAPHVSYLDTVIMWLSVRPQWARLLGRDQLWTVAGGLLGNIVSHVGATPIKRDSADRTAVKRAARMLKNGELVGIFPEGTRRGKGNKVPSLHAGVALIARMGKAPIVPLGLKNLHLVKQEGKFFRFPKITAEFGAPVLVSAFDFVEKDERLDACAWYVMRESYALSYDIDVEEVDMVSLFPESKDYTELFRNHEVEKFDPNTLPDYQG